MNKHYRQLAQEQRYQIWSLRDSGKALEAIGIIICFNKSTVSQELKWNSIKSDYHPKTAEELSRPRQCTAHKAGKRNEVMDKQITDKLKQGWSPGSISERLKLEKKAEADQLSHTSIYRMIARNKAQEGSLYLCLLNTGKT